MNKTISLAAIAMVAVIMGMSAFAPDAMAVKNSEHNPKVTICHFDYNEPAWEADKLVNAHALIAHLAHGDKIIDDDDVPEDGTISTDDCLAQDDLPPKDDL